MKKNTTKQRLLIGAHMSIADGFDQAILQADSIGCTTIQIFTKSNRQWRAKPIEEDAVAAFRDAINKTGIAPVVAHATYLINIGSSDGHIRNQSRAALAQELERCFILGIPYLVLHPGSYGKETEETCLQIISESLDAVLEADQGTTMILLETMAGQGSNVCSSFAQIAQLRAGTTHKKRIGVCLDTCHVFAAGYDLRTQDTYQKLWHSFDQTIGLNNLKTIHINDSKKELGARVDRHEDIGKGSLGMSPFEMLFNDHRFFDIPKILETPKDSLVDDKRNLDTIMRLLSEETKKILNIE